MTVQTSSRTARRQSTKADTRIACQRKTASVLRKARRPRAGNKTVIVEAVNGWRVTNSGTKKSVDVIAVSPEYAIHLAMSEHKLAKSEAKLSVERLTREQYSVLV